MCEGLVEGGDMESGSGYVIRVLIWVMLVMKVVWLLMSVVE